MSQSQCQKVNITKGLIMVYDKNNVNSVQQSSAMNINIVTHHRYGILSD